MGLTSAADRLDYAAALAAGLILLARFLWFVVAALFRLRFWRLFDDAVVQ